MTRSFQDMGRAVAVRQEDMVSAVGDVLHQALLRKVVQARAAPPVGRTIALLQIDLLQPHARRKDAGSHIAGDVIRNGHQSFFRGASVIVSMAVTLYPSKPAGFRGLPAHETSGEWL